jgi:hypothetical protein
MKPKWNKWITVIVIWTLVAMALAFNESHRWLGHVQVEIDVVILLIISIVLVVNWVRRGFDMVGSFGKSAGILGRIRRFAFDEPARGEEAQPK